MFFIRVTSIFLAFLFFATLAAAQDFGQFYVVEDDQTVAVLSGEITPQTPFDFRKLMYAYPDVQTLVLSSRGGLVSSGLLIADDVYQLELDTYVPKDYYCYSACSFIFLAGRSRLVDGELGVHQTWSDVESNESTQFSISDILEYLTKFGASNEVFLKMLRTPSEDMYVFNESELTAFGINASRPKSAPATSQDFPSGPTFSKPSSDQKISIGAQYLGLRLAIYEGLDLFGADISSARVRDLAQCAGLCLGDELCKAFTFNANPNLTRGPNCFLKSGFAELAAYDEAISGWVLTASETNAPKFSFATTRLLPNTDFPGNDILQVPFATATTADACQQACNDNAQCQAFSFVERLDHCWLKNFAANPISKAGITGGSKSNITFEAVSVISLDQ